MGNSTVRIYMVGIYIYIYMVVAFLFFILHFVVTIA